MIPAITPAITVAATAPTPAASTAAGAILPGMGMVLPGAPADQADAALPPGTVPPAPVPQTEFAAVLLPAMALAANGPTPFAAAEPPAVPHADGAPAATLAQAELPDQATEDDPAPPAWVMALIPELAAIVAGRPQDAGKAHAPAGVAGAQPMPWPPAPVTTARLPLVARPAPDWQRSLPGAPASAGTMPGDTGTSARAVPAGAAPAAVPPAITAAAMPAEPGIRMLAQPDATLVMAPFIAPSPADAAAPSPMAPAAASPGANALPLPEQLPEQLPAVPAAVMAATDRLRDQGLPLRATGDARDMALAVPADAASVAAVPAPAVALAAPAAQPATPPAAQPANLPAAAAEPAITMSAGNLGDVAVSLSGGPDALNVAMAGAPAAAALIDAQGQRLSQELANAGITLATLTVNGQRTDLGGGQRRQQPPRGEQPDPVAIRARRAPAMLPAVNPALAASLTIDRFA